MMTLSGPIASDVVLRDGSTVFVRPIVPGDAPAVSAFYAGLSAESRHARFLGMTDISHATANLFAGCQPDRGFALGAELAGRLVAVAGYVKDADAPHRAEVAFAIADAVQGHGLGTHLLQRLSEAARSEGIDTFDATVLASNTRMLHVLFDCGFDVHQERCDDVIEVTASLVPTDEFERKSAARAQEAATASMRGFFEPKTVAVIGASRNPDKIGSIILRNLVTTGFRGRVVAINPHADAIDGVSTYPSISAAPERVDLAVVAVPLECVDRVVDECLSEGVKSLVVITAGFAESGTEGRRREQALLAKVRTAGARLVGPNCLGVINTDSRVRLNATFAPVPPTAGRIALSTQSGALGLSLLDYAAQLNLGISSFISVGNKADVSGNDLLQYWADDPQTDLMLLYLESFGDPRQFAQIARRVARRKPVVVMKAGRSHAGARAAASHTGALAASDAVVEGLFRQAGIIRSATLEQFFGVATLLAHAPLPNGPRVGILTNAGGPGILAADSCELGELSLPPLAPDTMERLRAFLPPTASVGNPVDMIASATPEQFRHATAAILGDPEIDSLIVVYTPVLGSQPHEVATVIAEAAKKAAKPVLVVWLAAGAPPPALNELPVYRFPEAAAEGLASIARYAAWRGRPLGTVVECPNVRSADARAIVERALARGDGWLTPSEAQELVQCCGIPIAEARAATSEDEAVRAADAIGYPVVLKAIGPTILHKTEVGGVAVNLANREAVRRAHRDFTARLGDRLTGVLVQRHVEAGVEMLAGIVVDPLFGPLIACGSGGVLVELLKDTVFRLHPLTEPDVSAMIADIKGAALLHGFRGSPPADVAALRQVLLRLSALIEICPEIAELDINPLIVHRQGVCAVDVRVRVQRSAATSLSRRVRY